MSVQKAPQRPNKRTKGYEKGTMDQSPDQRQWVYKSCSNQIGNLKTKTHQKDRPVNSHLYEKI